MAELKKASKKEGTGGLSQQLLRDGGYRGTNSEVRRGAEVQKSAVGEPSLKTKELDGEASTEREREREGGRDGLEKRVGGKVGEKQRGEG